MDRIGRPSFAFEFVSLEETIKEVNKLSIKKAQAIIIPAEIIKENKDLISYLYTIISITRCQVRNTQTV